MNNFTAIISICFIFVGSLSLNAQTLKGEEVSDSIEITSFPVAWAGLWEGELNIFRENKLVQILPMALEILPIDSSDNYTWAIIYGEDKVAGRRAYELEIVDTNKGFYRIDERNSIKLEAYLFGNKLFSQFSVMGNQLLCSYEKIGNQIIFEIISGSLDPISVTGGRTVEQEDIPEVSAFPISVMQKGILKLSEK